jgi:hypothetical protein
LLHPEDDFLSKFKKIGEFVRLEDLVTIRRKLVEKTGGFSQSEKALFVKNRSIDPRFQHDLYELLKTQERRVLPPFPASGRFKDDLLTIFNLIGKHLTKERGQSHVFYTWLAGRWIRGIPYKRILEERIDYVLSRKPEISDNPAKKKREINKIIENMDEAIEDKIRFDYTRGLKCYCDIIDSILTEEKAHIDYCKNLPLYLESGASDESVLYLIGAGLSRNVAIEIFDVIRERGELLTLESVRGALEWLEENKPLLKNLIHPILYEEVERLLSS